MHDIRRNGDGVILPPRVFDGLSYDQKQMGYAMSKRDVLASLFRRNRGQWISLLVLLRIAPAQYSKRIAELRADGMQIENRKVYDKGRTVSSYRYVGLAK